MPVDAISVSIVDCATETLVTVVGQLDVASCDQLSTHLRPVVADSLGDVVVDMSLVSFADSAAVHLLTDLSLELFADGRGLVLTDPSPAVVRVLSYTGLLAWFAPER